ncbi:hypothetical protein [Paraburkholderia haematera]|uniref:Uncharacterized protein n=1 Tax=Paraburkholderia haematera TaxID=2793077 RepID=A0ABM8REX3_9BURK|nr:hypothetical protein [Paraburkholderia haematera]CAE6749274.1 hypothetical protein R69888_02894 [Paraburkholderia haematera]
MELLNRRLPGERVVQPTFEANVLSGEDAADALVNINQDSVGFTWELAASVHMARSPGYLHSPDGFRNIVLRTNDVARHAVALYADLDLFLVRKSDCPWRVFEFRGDAPTFTPKGNVSPVRNRANSTYPEV